jgi:hypothetical protein
MVEREGVSGEAPLWQKRGTDSLEGAIKREVGACPLAQIELNPGLGGTNTGLFEHCRGSVDTDHRSSGRLGDRNRYAPVPDCKLDEGPVRRPCQCQVESDVGRHLGRPLVVVLRESLVPAHVLMIALDGTTRGRASFLRRLAGITATQ